ncbi:MAG: carbohydrate kinase, partial [Bacilli bacterium]|nr:carbohydrate kinase [Bacilli bacterium]
YAKEFAKDFDNERDRGMIEELLDAELRKVPPGCEGLIVQPYWGPGLSRPFAKGAIIGFSDVHTRIHIYRAIIEGIAYSLREGLESIEHSQHEKVDHVMVSGGGSQSDDICQITADVFGLPVSRVQTFETTTLGAALSVFVAAKEFANVEEATHAMVHKTKTFYPNELAHKNYDTLYKKVYVKMYPQLKDVYRDLNKFLKRGN